MGKLFRHLVVALAISPPLIFGDPALAGLSNGELSAAPPLDPSTLVTECDRLAASPYDEQRPKDVAGIELGLVHGGPARSACDEAVRQFPNVARFLFQSGRVASGERDFARALREYEAAAALGNSAAMASVCGLYLNSTGVARDLDLARLWCEKSARAGNAFGMAALGVVYLTSGIGAVELAEARQWIDKSAALGSPGGLYATGYYKSQSKDPKDIAEALGWFRKAADTGMPVAMFWIGRTYQQGTGVTIDLEEARRWYEKAGAAGSAAGLMALTTMSGVAQDPTKVRKYYEQAAALNDPGARNAMMGLGQIYESGGGVPKDETEAWKWYRKSADGGFGPARKNLEQLEARNPALKALREQALAPVKSPETPEEKYHGWKVVARSDPLAVAASIAVSADGLRIATGGADNIVRTWDVNGRLLATMEGQPSTKEIVVAISPNGKLVAGYGDDESGVRVWDADSGHLLRTLDASVTAGSRAMVPTLAFSSDGTQVIGTVKGGTARSWDVASGNVIVGELADTSAVQFAPDGHRIVTGGCGSSLLAVRTSATQALLRGSASESECLASLAISPDGNQIVTASFLEKRGGSDSNAAPPGMTLKIWDANGGEPLRTLPATGFVLDIAMSRGDVIVVSSALPKEQETYYVRIQLWDASSGEPLRTLRLEDTALDSKPGAMPRIALSPNGKYLFANDSDGNLVCYTLDTGEKLWTSVMLGDSFAVIRGDGSFWADNGDLDKLQLVRGDETMPIPDDHKATFLRDHPFETATGSAK